MNFLRAKDYSASPVLQDLRTLPGGGLVVGDWLAALVLRGFGWHFDVGAFSTPIVGGGNGTVLDLDQPEFGVSVPTGYTLIPLRVDIAVAPGVQTTDAHETEILLAVDRAAKWAGDGTVVAETPTNLRTDLVGACPLTVFSAATVDITDPTLGIELAHALRTENFGDATGMELQELSLLYEPQRPPFLVGPCALYGYWGGDIAASGFANVDFLAIPSALLTSLV